MEDRIFNSLLNYTKALSVALGYRDVLTRIHSERVQGLSAEIGKCCGLSSHELNALNIAASFHDIGKIGTPDRILLKPSRLDELEWEIMKQHSEIGEKIMLSTDLEGSQRAARLIRHHHEDYNGRGYPDGLSGDDIPLCSRIISIADSYDAMAVTRSYHRVRTHPEIMGILHEETGKKYDPELMQVFCEVIESSKFRISNSEPDDLPDAAT
ncbi:MAG: HD domain-containing phosphohydrolase [Rhodanobacteraceae bacterium]